ncbi:hypothetical protein D3C78_584620 [compost metagenome]
MAVGRLVVGRAGVGEKGAGDAQAVVDLLEQLAVPLRAVQWGEQQARQFGGVQRPPALAVALEVGRADEAAAAEHAGAVGEQRQAAAVGELDADAAAFGVTQAHGQIRRMAVETRLTARQGVLAQVAVEQAIDGVALGLAVQGAFVGRASDKGHGAVSGERVSKG